MRSILLVGLGGFAGAVLRFLVGSVVQSQSGLSNFPLGTLTVNTMGSLAIGLLSQLALVSFDFSPQARLLIFTGFLGSFTTFSTFSNETVILIQRGQPSVAMLYFILHLLLGLGAVLIGYFVGSLL